MSLYPKLPPLELTPLSVSDPSPLPNDSELHPPWKVEFIEESKEPVEAEMRIEEPETTVDQPQDESVKKEFVETTTDLEDPAAVQPSPAFPPAKLECIETNPLMTPDISSFELTANSSASKNGDLSSDTDTSSDASSDDSDDSLSMPTKKLTMEEREKALVELDDMEDDDGDLDASKPSALLKTKNEITELPPVEYSPVTLPDGVPLEPIGTIHSIVETVVVVLANASGEFRVLDCESLLFLDERTSLGKVFDTLGPVTRPLYSVRFNSAADIQPERIYAGRSVFYAPTVPDMSSFVFTQPLRALKGSDASNLHDEEINDAEREFSDDEQELEHKRRTKKKKNKKQQTPNERQQRPPQFRQPPIQQYSPQQYPQQHYHNQQQQQQQQYPQYPHYPQYPQYSQHQFPQQQQPQQQQQHQPGLTHQVPASHPYSIQMPPRPTIYAPDSDGETYQILQRPATVIPPPQKPWVPFQGADSPYGVVWPGQPPPSSGPY